MGFWPFFLRIHVLLGLAKFSHDLLGICNRPWWQRGAESWKLKDNLRFGPRSTTDASAFPPGPSRSEWVSDVSDVLLKF